MAGNLCNGSPCADSVPPLIAHGARLELASIGTTRWVEAEHFLLAPSQTALKPQEILRAIHLPLLPEHAQVAYRSLSARSHVDVSAVSVATRIALTENRCSEARIVLGAVGPTPLRAPEAEALLLGHELSDELLEAAGQAAAAAARPITDVRASATWRRDMVAVLARRTIAQAWNQTGYAASPALGRMMP